MKKEMSTCPRLNLVQSILSCLVDLTNPDVDLSWDEFSSSLVNIKISVTTSQSQIQPIRGGL